MQGVVCRTELFHSWEIMTTLSFWIHHVSVPTVTIVHILHQLSTHLSKTCLCLVSCIKVAVRNDKRATADGHLFILFIGDKIKNQSLMRKFMYYYNKMWMKVSILNPSIIDTSCSNFNLIVPCNKDWPLKTEGSEWLLDRSSDCWISDFFNRWSMNDAYNDRHCCSSWNYNGFYHKKKGLTVCCIIFYSFWLDLTELKLGSNNPHTEAAYFNSKTACSTL